jgi:hypothetical protein
MNNDYFRPTQEPARTLYDALLDAAKHRKEFVGISWVDNERRVMWKTAMEWQAQRGLVWPTMAEIERVENMACGHCDYASKFALYVAELMAAKKELTAQGATA